MDPTQAHVQAHHHCACVVIQLWTPPSPTYRLIITGHAQLYTTKDPAQGHIPYRPIITATMDPAQGKPKGPSLLRMRSTCTHSNSKRLRNCEFLIKF